MRIPRTYILFVVIVSQILRAPFSICYEKLFRQRFPLSRYTRYCPHRWTNFLRANHVIVSPMWHLFRANNFTKRYQTRYQTSLVVRSVKDKFSRLSKVCSPQFCTNQTRLIARQLSGLSHTESISRVDSSVQKPELRSRMIYPPM